MDSLDKYTPLSPKVIAALEKEGLYDLKIGDIFLRMESHHADIYRVTKITKDRIYYQEAKDWEATEWEKEESDSISEFSQYKARIKIDRDKSVMQHWQEAKDLIDGKTDISLYEDHASDSLSNDTALMNKNSKESLLSLQQHLDEKRKKPNW